MRALPVLLGFMGNAEGFYWDLWGMQKGFTHFIWFRIYGSFYNLYWGLKEVQKSFTGVYWAL